MKQRNSARLLTGSVAVVLAAATSLVDLPQAQAQEIQLTGPLAGAPAVRQLRLHREGRFDVAPQVTFTLLDEYRRTIMPGVRLNYHLYDWFGIGISGGPGFSYNTALADQLQEKAIDDRNCDANPHTAACKKSKVTLCRGDDCLAENQLGRIVWMVAPQLTFVPFRGKVSLFSELFLDTDISLFIGGAIIGLNERADCELGTCDTSFELEHRVTGAPTFGLGLNFYPTDFMGFGAEFRGTPFAWNTSGFDKAGEDDDIPDDMVNNDDTSLAFNPMLTLFVSFQLPTEIKISD